MKPRRCVYCRAGLSAGSTLRHVVGACLECVRLSRDHRTPHTSRRRNFARNPARRRFKHRGIAWFYGLGKWRPELEGISADE